VAEEVQRQRAALNRVIAATRVDGQVARAFYDVAFMLRHSAALGDPALMQRVGEVLGAHSGLTPESGRTPALAAPAWGVAGALSWADRW
jgi:hypothetical protein